MSEAVKSVFEATFTGVPPIKGEIFASVWEVQEGELVSSNHIIRTDMDWIVRARWSIAGALASCICGDWCLHLYMESIGRGPEFHYPEDEDLHLKLDPCQDTENGKYWYQQDIRVPAGTIREEHCSVPYKPVVALTYRDYCERPGPMAGFVELPTIQFYPVEKPGQTNS
jgi:hypothetical protein